MPSDWSWLEKGMLVSASIAAPAVGFGGPFVPEHFDDHVDERGEGTAAARQHAAAGSVLSRMMQQQHDLGF